jgi:hypothetical protein
MALSFFVAVWCLQATALLEVPEQTTSVEPPQALLV